ncbi:MAG: PIN domain-containing protein [Candidatus Electrothrix sp. Rat3]|nr:PIN domain-containing protein [Candidatus Electrothrix rattekaaiensis]
MYLFDTNIFLEILLSQEKSSECKKILTDKAGEIFISDFSLHSIGVILFRHDKGDVFNKFTEDILPNVDVISLSTGSYKKLSILKNKYNLDFDDAYQYKVAKENDLSIVTIDKDFRRVEKKIKVKFI